MRSFDTNGWEKKMPMTKYLHFLFFFLDVVRNFVVTLRMHRCIVCRKNFYCFSTCEFDCELYVWGVRRHQNKHFVQCWLCNTTKYNWSYNCIDIWHMELVSANDAQLTDGTASINKVNRFFFVFFFWLNMKMQQKKRVKREKRRRR